MAKKEIPFGYIQDGKIYLNAFLDFPERLIGEVKDNDDEASVNYFIDRFEQYKAKVEELERLIHDTENKGSYLMKLRHMKDNIHMQDGLGDYEPLLTKLEGLEEVLLEVIQKNRVRNTDIKRALLMELEEAVKIVDWKEATDKVLDIKARWVKTGNASEELNDGFEQKFSLQLDDFFDRKKAYFEERKQLTDIRVKKYEDIIQKLKRGEVHKREALEAIKFEWKEVGKIPAFKYKALQREFNFLLKKAADPRRQAFDIPSEEQQHKNLEAKNALIAELQSLDEKDFEGGLMSLKSIKNRWKAIGMVPKSQYREQQELFNQLADTLREQFFLEKIAINRDKNYEQKNSREQVRVKMKILKDLLYRDEKELQTFYENLQKVSAQKSSFNKMLDKKLIQQKHKIQIKKALLKSLKASLDQI